MESGNSRLAVRGQLLILNLASFRRQNGQATSRPPCCNGRLRFLGLLVKLLQFLGFRFTTLSKALTAPAGRWACLTVDGSAVCIHDEILPTLQRHGVPATLFVPTDEIARDASGDWSTEAESIGPSVADPSKVLSWHHVRLLCNQGWEIGAGGHESVNLTEKSSEEQRQQIARARAVLTRRLGKAPRIFAYPYGAYDATTVSCVRDEGFEAAVTTKRGVNPPGDSFALHLKRLPTSAQRWRDLYHVVRAALDALRTPKEATTRARPVQARSEVAKIHSGSLS